MQPTYLPWLGYFDLLDQVDVFVLLDNVQFVRRSWQQRNRIKTREGLNWLTVPVLVSGKYHQEITEVQIAEPDFAEKHLRAIQMNYAKAPFFQHYFGQLIEQLTSAASTQRLVDLNCALIAWISSLLGVKTRVLRASELGVDGARSERLVAICKHVEADVYVSPPGSAGYLVDDLRLFRDSGVGVEFHHYEHPSYSQLFSPFLPYASVIDLLLTEGPGASDILRSGRRTNLAVDETAQQVLDPTIKVQASIADPRRIPSPTSGNILIRADGNAHIGTGHAMRSLALAQGPQRRGGRIVFAMAEATPALEQRIQRQGMEVMRMNVVPGSADDAARTAAEARALGAAWVVADGYCFGAEWQRQIKEAGFRLLLWDDYGHAKHYFADLVLNQNLNAEANLYAHREPYSKLLLGTRYVQLRPEFLAWRNWQRVIPPVARKVLVTLGGSDPDNVTGKVIQALARMHDLEAVIVVGGSNPNLEALQSSIAECSFPIRLEVDVGNMPELMAWADVAVSAAGSTSWELAFLGLPSIVNVLSENQSFVAAALSREGVSLSLGEHTTLSIDQIASALESLRTNFVLRERMSRHGRELVDGLGVSRVMSRMRVSDVTLRRACEDDCRLIWEWANDPQTRAVSFVPEPIPWEGHMRWYAEKSRHPDCLFYVAVDEAGKPIGQIRFDIVGCEGLVSVSVASAARGAGWGSALILRGVEEFFTESNASTVHAYIKSENDASIRAFNNANFVDLGAVETHGQRARHLVLKREML